MAILVVCWRPSQVRNPTRMLVSTPALASHCAYRDLCTETPSRPGPQLAVDVYCSRLGFVWIPVRYLHDVGFEGAWATSSYFGISVVILLPVAVLRWRRLREGGGNLVLIGVLSGTALEFPFHERGQRFTHLLLDPGVEHSHGQVHVGRTGYPYQTSCTAAWCRRVVVILARDSRLPLPSNAGDWMALSAGIIWAYAAVYLNRSKAQAIEFLNVFMLGGFIASVIVLLLRPEFATPPSFTALSPQAMAALVVIAIASLPVNIIILWAASLLSPARVGLLMLLEVVCGIAVASVITDEPYGLMEVVGTILILAAGVVDIFQPGTAKENLRENKDDN